LREKFDRARTRIDQSLSLFTEVEDPRGKVHILFAWSRLFGAEGQYEQAARLLGAIYAYEKGRGEITPGDRALLKRRLDAIGRALGAKAADAAFSEGCAMSVDEAIAYGSEHAWGPGDTGRADDRRRR
jgi:hypothetical protein